MRQSQFHPSRNNLKSSRKNLNSYLKNSYPFPLPSKMTPSKISLAPSPQKFLNPPPSKKKINSQPPLKIFEPHSKKSQPQKYIKTITPPPPPPSLFIFFFLPLFLHFSKKIFKFQGGLNPPPHPPLNTALKRHGIHHY